MNITKTKVMVVDNTPINVNADRKCPRLCVLRTTLQPQGKEPGQRDTTKNHGRLGGIRQTPGYLPKQPCHLPEELVYNSCVLPAMTYGAETWTLTKQAQNKLAAAQTKMERSMLNITYKDRRPNIWVRERTKLIDIIYTVRKMKWSWAGHITTDGPRASPLGDHMTRKDVKGDQPSCGETTWTNTGATRYGRGQHKTGSFGDDMLRPSPNHGTQRLPNDDEMMMM